MQPSETEPADASTQGEETLYKLQLRFKKDTILDLALTAKDCFYELRSYITDLPYLYFQPSFHFQFEDKKINEYNELEKEIDLLTVQQPIKIEVVLDEYDFKSAKELVRKINEFFRSPKKVISQIKMDSKANFIKLDFGNLLGKTNPSQKDKKKNLDLVRVLSEGLSSYPTIAKDPWHKFALPEKNTFVESLEFSGWNPPPSKRRMVGDFFYLKLVTFEAQVFHVTAFSRGFYLNNISEGVFDPSANSEPHFSLLELIATVSPHFKTLYDGNLFESVNVDIVDIPVPPHAEPTRWLKSFDEVDDHVFDQYRAAEDLYNNYRNGNAQFRDWNEELQNYKKIEAKDFYDHLNKAKIYERIQNDFLEAALEGAKAIVEGKLASMNVSIQQNDKCFIYNNIFYTFCSDDHLKVNQPRGDDAPSTAVTAARDMDNMKLLEEIDGKEVHTVQTALVRYKGFTVTAQSLIQGILYYDEKTWTKYGSVDEGKTISSDAQFAEVIKKISKLFHAKDDLLFRDKDGKEFAMVSPIDIKGILGGDNRKYVLDLFRMCPRDLNWEGPEFDAVVFRPKLVENYLYQLKLDVTEEKRAQYSERFSALKQQQQQLFVQAAQRQGKPSGEEQPKEEQEAQTQELKESLQRVKDELQQLQVQMYREIEEEIKTRNIGDYRFDTSLYSGLESCYADPALEQAERDKLRKLAAFAREKMVKTFLDEWNRMAKVAPLDTASLVSALHSFGLSSRYLGFLLQQLDPQNNMKHHLLAQRAVLVRSLKHLFEHVLRTVPAIQVPDTLSHLLNCVIAGRAASEFLETKVAHMSRSSGEALPEPGAGDKKKKKKKVKKVLQVKCDIEPNEFMLYTPKQLFAAMNQIAEARYKHRFAQSHFYELVYSSNALDRVSLLRELALSIGLCLSFRDYLFEEQENPSFFELPVKPSDIGDFVPIIKKQDAEFSYAKVNYNLGAQYVGSGKYESAIEIYSSTLQALLNIYGPCNHSVLEFATTLGALYASVSKKEQAISIQKSVLKLTEKTYGADNLLTVSAYVDLARYYFENDNTERMLGCLLSALFLADLVGGSMNVESVRLLEELMSFYVEKKEHSNALTCAEELKNRYLRVFEKNSPQVAWIYFHLATLHHLLGNQKEATNYAQLRLAVISKHFKTSNPAKVEEAKKFANQITSGSKPQTLQSANEDMETSLLREKLHQSRLLYKRK